MRRSAYRPYVEMGHRRGSLSSLWTNDARERDVVTETNTEIT
jgi:hypothetical protein